jgi:hypothetical protein
MRKKVSCDGGDSGSKKCSRVYGACCHAVGFVLIRSAGIWQSPEDALMFNLLDTETLLMLYFQCDLQRSCCIKLCYCFTQKCFIPVNFDALYAIINVKIIRYFILVS